MLAALGQRDAELGGERLTEPDRGSARRQAVRVAVWSVVAAVLATGASILFR